MKYPVTKNQACGLASSLGERFSLVEYTQEYLTVSEKLPGSYIFQSFKFYRDDVESDSHIVMLGLEVTR